MDRQQLARILLEAMKKKAAEHREVARRLIHAQVRLVLHGWACHCMRQAATCAWQTTSDNQPQLALALHAGRRRCSKRRALRQPRGATLAATKLIVQATISEVLAVTQDVQDMEQQVSRLCD